MLIDEQTKQQLLALPVEEVATALGITVKRHQALCFMHDDHHPSLAFMPKSNRWKCFVCGKWGNNIDLVEQKLGLNFVDACRWLGRQFNIPIEGASTQPILIRPIAAPKPKPQETTIVDTLVLQCLVDKLKLTERAKSFLCEERRYSESVITSLHLCAAETDKDILDILFSNFPAERIQKSGMAYQYKGQWQSYFHAPCLFFPYYDESGKLETLQARYLGNPEEHQRFQFPRGSKTMIFNLPILNTLEEGEILFVSEGVTDCIALLSTGRKAVAIPSASTLKPKQLEQIITHPIGMYPDNDAPGERLYTEIAELIHANHGQIFRFSLPKGCKDFSVLYSAVSKCFNE